MAELFIHLALLIEAIGELPLTPPVAYELARMTINIVEVTR